MDAAGTHEGAGPQARGSSSRSTTTGARSGTCACRRACRGIGSATTTPTATTATTATTGRQPTAPAARSLSGPAAQPQQASTAAKKPSPAS